VHLGMSPQFTVETRAGRVVSHRLADESIAPLQSGARVALSWEPEHTSLLGDSPPVSLVVERAEPPLGDAPPHLGGDDDE